MEEPSGARAINEATLTDKNMSPEMCVAFCAKSGMKYAGIEYSVGMSSLLYQENGRD
jgi:hypothetical protein